MGALKNLLSEVDARISTSRCNFYSQKRFFGFLAENRSREQVGSVKWPWTSKSRGLCRPHQLPRATWAELLRLRYPTLVPLQLKPACGALDDQLRSGTQHAPRWRKSSRLTKLVNWHLYQRFRFRESRNRNTLFAQLISWMR